MAGAKQSIEIDAPMSVLYGVITDYERYPEFLSDMEAARVVRREGDTVDVEFRLNLIKRITYTLRLVGQPERGIHWTLADGPFKVNTGGWVLREISPGRTHATYEIEVAVGMFIPGSIANKLVGKTLPATLNAFKARAEVAARSGGSSS